MKLPVQLVESFDDVQQNFEAIQFIPNWIPAVLINSWADGGEGVPAYVKDPFGFVHMRGLLTTGTSATVAFVLPVGYRPGVATYYPTVQGAGAAGAYVHVDTSGNVAPTYTSAGARLTAVTFLAEN